MINDIKTLVWLFKLIAIPLIVFMAIVICTARLFSSCAIPSTLLTISAVSLIGLLNLRKRRNDKIRGWRAGRAGRDLLYYEEFINGKWIKMILDGEMLVGKIHHVIYADPDKFPGWAIARKSEICKRIRSTFNDGYEYHCEEKWKFAQQVDSAEAATNG